jgi:hypothetical protein
MAYEEWETGNLIGSDKVEGTAVYGANSKRIGSIERVMIDKMRGKVAYAVLGFGGFLGIGDDHYPLPWQSLKYDTNLGGYVTGATDSQLKGARKYSNESSWNWSDPSVARLRRHSGSVRNRNVPGLGYSGHKRPTRRGGLTPVL